MLLGNEKEFIVSINEVLRREVMVKAASQDVALEKVLSMYKEQDIILDWGDFVDVDFDPNHSFLER